VRSNRWAPGGVVRIDRFLEVPAGVMEGEVIDSVELKDTLYTKGGVPRRGEQKKTLSS